jgi:hypothetical protein
MEVLCRHVDPCRENRDFSRVIYCVRVSQPLFDLFFNSENGYRGVYFKSPYAGLEANAAFIRSLEPRLFEWTRMKHGADVVPFAQESLGTPSAKAWLAEHGKGYCDQCAGEWSTPRDETAEILNGRWEYADCLQAKWGRKAPYLSQIKVFGALLNEGLDEFVPAVKRYRAQEVHEFGWA